MGRRGPALAEAFLLLSVFASLSLSSLSSSSWAKQQRPGGAASSAGSCVLLQYVAPPFLGHRCGRPHLRRSARHPEGMSRRMGSEGQAGSDLSLVEVYEIEECEPNEATAKLARKNRENLELFLARRPEAPHNLQAFNAAREAYEAHCGRVGSKVPVVLDSCCGTGRSSIILAEERPDSFVVGIDKSEARLSRNRGWREGAGSHSIPQNVVLVRGDCTDLWRSAWRHGWNVAEHFMCYPNPYPKRSDLGKRWHGGPSFPILLGLGGRIEVRATWRTYLEEMAIAADTVSGTGLPPIGLVPDDSVGISNFEIKYRGLGLPCYRMVLPALEQRPFPT
jgi:tRNA (guanine-N7-)-methyltransferase